MYSDPDGHMPRWANKKKIVGFTPLTKTAGFTSGFYSQSYIMSDVLKLMKLDGFSIKNFLGGSLSSIVDRYKNGNDYLSMKTSKVGLATSYGFAAVNFIKLGVAIGSSNYEEIAKTSGYILL